MFDPHEESYNIANRQRFIDTEEDYTSTHGVSIFDIASYLAPGASYYLYQAIDETGELNLTSFADAVKAACDESITLLNISAGRHRPSCSGHCGFCRVAKRAVQQGITLITAAGNKVDDEHETINCPGFADDVITVAGYEALCTYDASIGPQRTGFSNLLHPPLAYWARGPSDLEPVDEAATGAYCSGRGCGANGDCEKYREYQEWDHNPTKAGSKPDVLAPIHYVPYKFGAIDEDKIVSITSGSSYAAPIVTGVIAWALGVLLDHQLGASPYEIKQAVIHGSEEMNSAPAGRFDAVGLLDELM